MSRLVFSGFSFLLGVDAADVDKRHSDADDRRRTSYEGEEDRLGGLGYKIIVSCREMLFASKF